MNPLPLTNTTMNNEPDNPTPPITNGCKLCGSTPGWLDSNTPCLCQFGGCNEGAPHPSAGSQTEPQPQQGKPIKKPKHDQTLGEFLKEKGLQPIVVSGCSDPECPACLAAKAAEEEEASKPRVPSLVELIYSQLEAHNLGMRSYQAMSACCSAGATAARISQLVDLPVHMVGCMLSPLIQMGLIYHAGMPFKADMEGAPQALGQIQHIWHANDVFMCTPLGRQTVNKVDAAVRAIYTAPDVLERLARLEAALIKPTTTDPTDTTPL